MTDTPFDENDASLLASPLRLSCGRTVQNRFVKAALYEAMASFGGGPPTQEHLGIYRAWSKGGWGVILTGNVQVFNDALTLGRDLCLPLEATPVTLAPFTALAQAMHDELNPDAIALMQLSHAGRQSPRLWLGGRNPFTPPVGASDLPMQSPDGWLARRLFSLLFMRPRPLTDDQVEEIAERFVFGAQFAHEAGFDGVQLHCSHGYLLAQFLSHKTNTRSLPYGFPTPLYLIHSIVKRIRASVPRAFVLALKLNASDYVHGGLSEEEALEQVRTIAGWDGMVDMIEISGGDYEHPEFVAKTSIRQAFFSSFSRKALDAVESMAGSHPNMILPRIILTGSLRTRALLASSIRASHAELLGIGRPSIAFPNLPRLLLSAFNKDGSNDDPFPPTPNPPTGPLESWLRIGLLNAGYATAWWIAVMRRQSRLLLESIKTGGEVKELQHSEVPGAVGATIEMLLGGTINVLSRGTVKSLIWWVGLGACVLLLFGMLPVSY